MTTIMLYYFLGGIVLVLLSLPLWYEKIPRNFLYGFRVRATLEDPKLWYAANKFAARRMMWTGAATSAGALVLAAIPGITLDSYSLACLAVFAAAMGITLFQSFRFLRRAADPSGKD